MSDSVPSSEDRVQADEVLRAIWTRRVVRDFTQEEVPDDDLQLVVESARWASSAGNRHINKLLVIRNAETIRLLRMVSPGMLGRPPVLVVILTDLADARRHEVQVPDDMNVWIDVGTTAATMMLTAHAIGLGSCPATSFSQAGAKEMLELPDHLRPDFILQLGYPQQARDPDLDRIRDHDYTKDYVFWETAAGGLGRS